MALESVILDARGNPYQGSVDQISGQTITDTRTSSFLLGALNAESVMDLNGKATYLVDVRTAAGNLTFITEGTVDGTNYVELHGFNAETETMAVSTVITTTVDIRLSYIVSGYRRVRTRVSAYTSGNITVSARASTAQYYVYARPVASTLHVTATAAANTLTTATLPAAGQGLHHYITSIDLTRNATAALAGTATIIHTTTNLPGSPAWSVGNAMAAGGTQIDVQYRPTTPLKSLTANTATTVVMPAAGIAVLNRINVSYYVGA